MLKSNFFSFLRFNKSGNCCGKCTTGGVENLALDAEDVFLDIAWDTVTDATSYELRFGLDSTLVNHFTYQILSPLTSQHVTDLTPETAYYAQIRALGPCGAGAWSDIETTTTTASD